MKLAEKAKTPGMSIVVTPDNPAPADPRTAAVRTADGLVLRVVRWHPLAESRGTVVIATGRAEFIEKYFETAAELLARQLTVVVFDWRGQGYSSRELDNARKGHIDDFSLYERDIDAIVMQVLEPFCPRPWFALGHSMGGAILLNQAHRNQSPFERLALSAPMIELFGVRRPRAARLLAGALDMVGLGGAFIPGGGGTAFLTRPFDGNVLTSDPGRYARTAAIVAAAGDLAIGDPTIGWVNAAFRLIGEFAQPDYPRQTLTPILVFVAGDDRVVDSAAIERFAHRLKAGRLVLLPQSRHEILMERDSIREQFWTAFDAFIPGARDEMAALLATAEARKTRRRWKVW